MSARAQIIISNFLMTSNNLSFDISGTLPNTPPPTVDFSDALYFVNSDPASLPGFARWRGTFVVADFSQFSGLPQIGTSQAVGTGNTDFGDYFYVAFENDLTTGQSIFGTLNATWNSAAFVPERVSTLNVFWGYNENLPVDPSTQPSGITGGTFLTSVVVPEPSTYALLVMTGAGALWLARRRR